MGKLKAASVVAKQALKKLKPTKAEMRVVGLGVGAGVMSNAIGGQYPTKPTKRRVKRALRGK